MNIRKMRNTLMCGALAATMVIPMSAATAQESTTATTVTTSVTGVTNPAPTASDPVAGEMSWSDGSAPTKMTPADQRVFLEIQLDQLDQQEKAMMEMNARSARTSLDQSIKARETRESAQLTKEIATAKASLKKTQVAKRASLEKSLAAWGKNYRASAQKGLRYAPASVKKKEMAKVESRIKAETVRQRAAATTREKNDVKALDRRTTQWKVDLANQHKKMKAMQKESLEKQIKNWNAQTIAMGEQRNKNARAELEAQLAGL